MLYFLKVHSNPDYNKETAEKEIIDLVHVKEKVFSMAVTTNIKIILNIY